MSKLGESQQPGARCVCGHRRSGHFGGTGACTHVVEDYECECREFVLDVERAW